MLKEQEENEICIIMKLLENKLSMRGPQIFTVKVPV